MSSSTPSYPLALSSWDGAEQDALRRVIESGQFTMGQEVAQFERNFAQFIGTRHAVMVNSGSSANLLLLSALRYHSGVAWPVMGDVIVPAVSWGTTYFPVTQNGLRLKFVDVSGGDWNIDPQRVVEAIDHNTVAVFAVSLLGAPAALTELRALCIAKGIVLLEDNCESLGASLDGRLTGSIGLAGTHSGFFSHHICTMEGGLITTDDDELRDLMFSMRAHGWLRGLPPGNHVHPLTGDAFDDSYTFALPGYNLRPLELSGAAGIEQLKKLPEMLRVRRLNAERFVAAFADHDAVSIQRPRGESSWFGFGMQLKGTLEGRRRRVVEELSARGVESRPVVAGNFLKNPVMKHLSHIAEGDFSNADQLDRNGLFVGNHHIELGEEFELVAEALRAAMP